MWPLLWTGCMCLPRFLRWSPSSSVMVLGGRGAGQWLGYEGGLMNEIWVLRHERGSLCLSTQGEHNKRTASICKPASEPAPDTELAGLPAPDEWGITVCCFSHPICGNLLQEPNWPRQWPGGGTANLSIQRSGFKTQPEAGAEIRTRKRRGLKQTPP